MRLQERCNGADDSPNQLKSAYAKKFDLLDINLEEMQEADSSNDSWVE